VQYDQVARLYREFLSAQAGELTIVGDFDPEPCVRILKETLSGWTSGQPYARIAASPPPQLTGSQQQIRTPDKANANYIAGLVFPLRDDDPDYPALVMGNYILGAGTLSSRLGVRVRQKEGLSYGISSLLSASAFDRRASLTISAICNPQNIARVEKAVQEELDRFAQHRATHDKF